MRSCLILGQVRHRRWAPVAHEFRYPLYMYLLDLDELSELDKKIGLFGYNHFAPVAVHDRDYFQNVPGSIKQKLLRFLKQEGFNEPLAEIKMVTAARYFNYIFNPVSLYFCRRPDNSLACVVAEVNNTFKEKHVYLLAEPLPPPPGYQHRFRIPKKFHVSPFFERTGEYEFLLKELDRKFDVLLNYYQDGKMMLSTRLSGDYLPLDQRNLLKTLLTRPLQAAKTMPRILFQAAILFFRKRLHYYFKPDPADPHTLRGEPPWFWERFYMKIVLRIFSKIKQGLIKVILPDGQLIESGQPHSPQPGVIKVKRYRFFTRLFFASDIGFGESYVDGDWDSPGLIEVLNILAQNIELINKGSRRLPRIQKLFDILGHRRRKNTPVKAEENISSHYDTSNAFFKQVLGPSLVYSSAFFKNDRESLEQAQQNKINMIIGKAQLKPGDHLLEIGSGWGAFALAAARQAGCRVTTTTISQEQFEHVRQLVNQAGLSDRVTVIKEDYRQITGSFDKIVSIEMLEAVGHEYFGQYFRKCDQLLKPGGRAVYQVITIPHERYSGHRRKIDWLQKYIFPGGLLPSFEILDKNLRAQTSMKVTGKESIGQPHYARTLAEWRRNLLANRAAIEQLGFTEWDIRKWEYYFSYCEAAFTNQKVDDLQIVAEKSIA